MHNEVRYGTQEFYTRVQARGSQVNVRARGWPQAAKDLDIGASVVGRSVQKKLGGQEAMHFRYVGS